MPSVVVEAYRCGIDGVTVTIKSDYSDFDEALEGENSLEARACEIAKLYIVAVVKDET